MGGKEGVAGGREGGREGRKVDVTKNEQEEKELVLTVPLWLL